MIVACGYFDADEWKEGRYRPQAAPAGCMGQAPGRRVKAVRNWRNSLAESRRHRFPHQETGIKSEIWDYAPIEIASAKLMHLPSLPAQPIQPPPELLCFFTAYEYFPVFPVFEAYVQLAVDVILYAVYGADGYHILPVQPEKEHWIQDLLQIIQGIVQDELPTFLIMQGYDPVISLQYRYVLYRYCS